MGHRAGIRRQPLRAGPPANLAKRLRRASFSPILKATPSLQERPMSNHPIRRSVRTSLSAALALALLMEIASATSSSALDPPGGRPPGPRTIDYPYTTTSIYEHS